MKIKLSPNQEYVYPVMKTKNIKIYEHIAYGGDKSVTVPCGFVTTLVYEKVKKRSMNNRLRAVANKLDIPSSTNKPNG